MGLAYDVAELAALNIYIWWCAYPVASLLVREDLNLIRPYGVFG
jgi:hypothetical protein